MEAKKTLILGKLERNYWLIHNEESGHREFYIHTSYWNQKLNLTSYYCKSKEEYGLEEDKHYLELQSFGCCGEP